MKRIAQRLKSACQDVLMRRKVEKQLRKIAREPDLSGAVDIREDLKSLLQRQMAAAIPEEQLHNEYKGIKAMIAKYKTAITVIAIVLAGVVVYSILPSIGTDEMPTLQLPTLAQLAQASEIAATKVNSLRMIGRDTERGELQDFEIFIKNPFFNRKNFADGGYTIMHIDKRAVYDKANNTFTIVPVDMRARLEEMGLEADTAATSMFTKALMMTIMTHDPKGPQIPESDIKIEDTRLDGQAVYKVLFPSKLGDFEIYFDKATGLVLKGYVMTEEGIMGGEVVEVNPELSDDLFSMEPPAGATVIDRRADVPKTE